MENSANDKLIAGDVDGFREAVDLYISASRWEIRTFPATTPSDDDCFRDSIAAGQFVLLNTKGDEPPTMQELKKLRVDPAGSFFWGSVELLLAAYDEQDYTSLGF